MIIYKRGSQNSGKHLTHYYKSVTQGITQVVWVRSGRTLSKEASVPVQLGCVIFCYRHTFASPEALQTLLFGGFCACFIM